MLSNSSGSGLSNLNRTDSRTTKHDFSSSYVLSFLITTPSWPLFSCKIHLVPQHPLYVILFYIYLNIFLSLHIICFFQYTSAPWRQEQRFPPSFPLQHLAQCLWWSTNAGWMNGLVNLTNIYWVPTIYQVLVTAQGYIAMKIIGKVFVPMKLTEKWVNRQMCDKKHFPVLYLY